MNAKFFLNLFLLTSVLLAACTAPSPTAAPTPDFPTPNIAPPTPTSTWEPFPAPQPGDRNVQPGTIGFDYIKDIMLIGQDGEAWGCLRELCENPVGIDTTRIGGNPPMPRYIIFLNKENGQIEMVITSGSFLRGKLVGNAWSGQDVYGEVFTSQSFDRGIQSLDDLQIATRLLELRDWGVSGELCLTAQGLAPLYPCYQQ